MGKRLFLADEIDKSCVAAMEYECSESQMRKVGTTIIDVVCSILKSGENELKLQPVLVTGICKLGNSGLSPLDNTVKVYFLSDSRFFKYYGLTAQEVDSLVRTFFGSEGDAEIEKLISHIDTYYSDYCEITSSGEKNKYARYCLFCVLSYIKHRNENKNQKKWSFWTDGGFFNGNCVS